MKKPHILKVELFCFKAVKILLLFNKLNNCGSGFRVKNQCEEVDHKFQVWDRTISKAGLFTPQIKYSNATNLILLL